MVKFHTGSKRKYRKSANSSTAVLSRSGETPEPTVKQAQGNRYLACESPDEKR